MNDDTEELEDDDERDDRTCDDCRFAHYKDEGYSDYTVEYTALHCILGQRRPISAERFERIKKPKHCNDWRFGKQDKFSVEEKCPCDRRL